MEITAETEVKFRRIFRSFNKFMLALWRLGLGGFGNPTKFGGAVMIIKYRGWKTGLTLVALFFVVIDDGLLNFEAPAVNSDVAATG